MNRRRLSLDRMAAALSPNQRQALIDHPDGNHTLMLGFARSILIYRGILDYRRRWWIAGPRELVLTVKGRRLREHLRAALPTPPQDKDA